MNLFNFLVCKNFGIVFTDKRFIISSNGRTVLNRLACVSIYKPTGEFVCAGDEVTCIGLAPNGVPCYPILGGVICKYQEADYLFSELLKEVQKWYNLFTHCNVAIPVVTGELERRALVTCFNNIQCHTAYMPLITSKIIGNENITVIYLAESFTEISIVNLNRISHFTFWNYGIEELYPLFSSLFPEIRVSQKSLRRISEAYFNGQGHHVIGPDWQGNPLEKILTYTNLCSVASPWLNNIADKITSFIKNYEEIDRIALICDIDNIDTLGKMLSDKLSRMIIPINYSLNKMANYLSICNDMLNKYYN